MAAGGPAAAPGLLRSAPLRPAQTRRARPGRAPPPPPLPASPARAAPRRPYHGAGSRVGGGGRCCCCCCRRCGAAAGRSGERSGAERCAGGAAGGDLGRAGDEPRRPGRAGHMGRAATTCRRAGPRRAGPRRAGPFPAALGRAAPQGGGSRSCPAGATGSTRESRSCRLRARSPRPRSPRRARVGRPQAWPGGPRAVRARCRPAAGPAAQTGGRSRPGRAPPARPARRPVPVLCAALRTGAWRPAAAPHTPGRPAAGPCALAVRPQRLVHPGAGAARCWRPRQGRARGPVAAAAPAVRAAQALELGTARGALLPTPGHPKCAASRAAAAAAVSTQPALWPHLPKTPKWDLGGSQRAGVCQHPRTSVQTRT